MATSGAFDALAKVAGGDRSVIRLKAASPAVEHDAEDSQPRVEEPRKGFDYGSFVARLESLWFQRKTYLDNGRTQDAHRQLEQIRAFCAEEGIQRLETIAAALVTEAHRYLVEGHHEQALVVLEFAESFDPGRPQVYRARASALWQTGAGPLAATTEMLRALRYALERSIRDLTLFHHVLFVLVLATLGSMVLFSVFMLLRYQGTLRHEVDEWAYGALGEHWSGALGWAVLLAPALIWIGAGWIALYWIVLTFRYMGRSERFAAAGLLIAGVLVTPMYRIAVASYGVTADPAVRTTLGSVAGEYDPDRIVRLQQLVGSRPDDPVYRFLLAGLYKNGRYYEEAFESYKVVLRRDATLIGAHINIGNIFYMTGQYAEAVANYRRAQEIAPNSFLAAFNMHLAQSEAFRFADAEESLQRARELDARRVAQLLSAATSEGDRAVVQDARLEMGSVWQAALAGRRPFQAEQLGWLSWLRRLVDVNGAVSLLALLGCAVLNFLGQRFPPARSCIRCGKPFCELCKSGRDAHEYCTQCVHLFVLGDGLIPESKSRKLYEVELHERRSRRVRRLISLLLPGAGHVLGGKPGRGVLLVLCWLAAWIAWQPLLLTPLHGLAGVRLHVSLLEPSGVPAFFRTHPFGLLALMTLPLIWLLAHGPVWRRRES